MGGSYMVENLTTELEQKASEYLSKIDDLGGAVAAIERGYQQREIQNAAYLYQREIETKDRIIVGVNEFTAGDEPPTDILKVNPELEDKQKRAVAKVRAERDSAKATKTLGRVEAAAREGSNVMPAIVDAVRSWCTLGEIADAMRKVFGEYKPVNTL
jgi:methylmalonyl-CoA mutase N-terminal domain/subunit